MPATTPGRNLPYPLGTDRLMDGDDSIRKLAQSVENMVQTARVTVPITAANTTTNVVYTFPVAFAAAPMAVTSVIGGAVATASVSVGGTTTTNVTIQGTRSSAVAFDAFVIAVGPVTAVS